MASKPQLGGNPRRITELTYQSKPIKSGTHYPTPSGLFIKQGSLRLIPEPNISFSQTISEQEARLVHWFTK